MVVIHYTDLLTCQDALDILTDPTENVSSHYVIEKNGHLYRLVSEDRVAHHSGISSWRDRTGINTYSIGIELDNGGHQFGPEPFPDAQIKTLIELLADIRTRHPIRNDYIVAHSDVAPSRKQDPGTLFPWKTLAQNGMGLWADEDLSASHSVIPLIESQRSLRTIGYDAPLNGEFDTATQHIVTAFQRHYMPHHMTSQCDSRTSHHIQKIARLMETSR